MLFALSGVLSLVPAVVEPVIKGEPLNYAFIVIASMFFTFAIVFGRKSSSGSRPRSS